MYRIWLQIEHMDLDRQEERDVGLPDPIGPFESLTEAQESLRAILLLTNPAAIRDSDQLNAT